MPACVIRCFSMGLLLLSTPMWGAVARPRHASELGLSGPGSVPWNIVVVLTLLTFVPALLLSMTPFVRLLVVFHFLRQALGTQNTPSNQTLIGLSLVLTYFLMQPVGMAIHRQAIVPYQEGRATAMQSVELASGPMKTFM